MIPDTSMHRRRFVQLTAAASAGALLGAAPARAQSVSGLFDDIPLADQVLGDVNAPVTLVEYASMTCPHCRTFHENILPEVKEKFIDTGKAKLILRPFPFNGDRRGEAAFMLALCAPNNKYYAMIDALFSTQDVWANPQTNPVPELLRLSRLSGMSEGDFKACLENQDQLNKMIQGRNKAATEFGVSSTPTIFINDEKFSGELSKETFVKAIEDAL